MGTVLARSAGTERIFEDLDEGLGNGRRRAGRVEDAAKAEHQADNAALDEDDKLLLVVDSASDLEVGAAHRRDVETRGRRWMTSTRHDCRADGWSDRAKGRGAPGKAGTCRSGRREERWRS